MFTCTPLSSLFSVLAALVAGLHSCGSVTSGSLDSMGVLLPNDGGLWKDKVQHLVFEGGTRVTVLAPQMLDRERLFLVAKQVKVVTKNRASACFCQFKTTVAKGPSDAFADVDCACRARDSGLMEAAKPSTDEPLDIYGAPDSTPYNKRFRYNAGSRMVASRGLVLCLDAGDRKSYSGVDGRARRWSDVSASNFRTEMQGQVTFHSEEGFGAMRFGAHGGGDLLTVLGLDLGPRARAGLTIEAWVKIVGVPNGRGWLFGNDNAARETDSTYFDRGLFLHDTRFGPDRTPAKTTMAAAAEAGRTAMGIGHEYQSLMPAPTVGEWTHIVGVWRQGGGSAIYRNTIRQTLDSRTYNFDGARDAVVGGHPHLRDYHVDALLAVLRVYDRPLSAEEVQANYDFSAPRFGISTPPTDAEIKTWNPHYMD